MLFSQNILHALGVGFLHLKGTVSKFSGTPVTPQIADDDDEADKDVS